VNLNEVSEVKKSILLTGKKVLKIYPDDSMNLSATFLRCRRHRFKPAKNRIKNQKVPVGCSSRISELYNPDNINRLIWGHQIFKA